MPRRTQVSPVRLTQHARDRYREYGGPRETLSRHHPAISAGDTPERGRDRGRLRDPRTPPRSMEGNLRADDDRRLGGRDHGPGEEQSR